MAIVTISKEYASGIEAFIKLLAERLHYSVLDSQLVKEAAKQLGVETRAAAGVPGQPAGGLMRHFLDRATGGVIKGLVNQSYGRLDHRIYYEAAAQLIVKAAQQGNVIVVGWGGQCVLKDHSRAIHLRVVKDRDERIAWLKRELAIDRAAAQSLIEREEHESAEFIKHSFNQKWDDPHLYHLLLNFSRITVEEAVNLTVSLLQQRNLD